MKLLLYTKQNLNKSNAPVQTEIVGIFKKRKKVTEIIEKKAKELGISDQWNLPGIKDADEADTGGNRYTYEVVNVTEDVPINKFI